MNATLLDPPHRAGAMSRWPPPTLSELALPPRWQVLEQTRHAAGWPARLVIPLSVPRLARVQAPSRFPRLVGAVRVAAMSICWGAIIGVAAGATSGTLVVPLFGTCYGAIVGVIVGLLAGAAWAPVVVAVLLGWHRQPVVAYGRLIHVARTVVVLVAVLVALAVIAVFAALAHGQPGIAIWVAANAGATTFVVVRLLRRAIASLDGQWSHAFGWR